MSRILFIASHRPGRSPSQRFRYEQYLPYLRANGFECDESWIISEKDDKVFYSPGNIFTKGYIFLKSAVRRVRDTLRAKHYDIVFVQREAFMTGSVFFEKRFSKKSKLVFDFDDAIWLLDVSEANKRFGWLKNPQKTQKLIAMARLVIAGNDYLAEFARQYNKNTVVIPTTIDTDLHKRTPFDKKDERVCIGWTGSLTTIKHFDNATPFLLKLKERFGSKIYFKVIGDESYRNERLGVKGIAWNENTEVQDMAEFDIGIMPLPDDKWARGKCGLKGLSYMAMEIPTVMSRVGVNTGIIRDGVNGLLAGNENEWIEKISRLVEDSTLRANLGKSGRQTVVDKYSVLAQRENYFSQLQKLVKEK
ncbi:MAG TPA: glycosyltransferase family 4 protein [Bacteroidia bacterium]|jgi:glycosyltransferase involved in cell wall biosynthesis